MPFYDSEAIERERQVDLLTYLQTCEPQELVHVSGNVYCTKTHDSLRISNGKWCWFSRGIGGYSALDYLIKVNGYSFLEAMETISGRAAIPPPSFVPAPKEEKPKHLLLPQAAPDNRAMMAYLKGRGIDQEILDYCVQTGRIYESRNKGHSNVVFVGFDKDGKHAFDKSYSSYGVPYVQENCDIGISDNLVLYGHHMNNGSMFSDLCKYESEDFYREHKIIHFDTLESFGEYEVIAAFKTVAYSQEGFKYYHFVRAESAEQFDEYIAGCKELALYDTGVTAEYGDKLITLSTCEYSRTNGRMVVVAKLLEE